MRLSPSHYSGGSQRTTNCAIKVRINDDCSAGNNPQDGKADCDDFAPLTDPVFILATDKSNPDDGNAIVWFEGTVGLDEERIRKYIREQEKLESRQGDLDLS